MGDERVWECERRREGKVGARNRKHIGRRDIRLVVDETETKMEELAANE